MIFVVGGMAQGKSEYCKKYAELGYEICDDFKDRIEASMKDGSDIYIQIDELIKNTPKLVIVGTEMGMGVVPIDKEKRALREYNGRVNCYLASKASEVYFISCGIGDKLK